MKICSVYRSRRCIFLFIRLLCFRRSSILERNFSADSFLSCFHAREVSCYKNLSVSRSTITVDCRNRKVCKAIENSMCRLRHLIALFDLKSSFVDTSFVHVVLPHFLTTSIHLWRMDDVKTTAQGLWQTFNDFALKVYSTNSSRFFDTCCKTVL